MEEIAYQGEHLIPGILGNIFILISFLGAILSVVGYYMGVRKKDDSWKKFGRNAFRAHSVGVIGIFVTLFYLLFNHHYEYSYVWSHLNNSMPMQYILSCFWEGQEGSFLLWTFWHVILGNILIHTARKWEARTMTIFALVQVFLASMLVGIYIGDFQFGQNPFVLLRESMTHYGLPWTKNPNYLTEFAQFQDGQGLNPLLQNYWMVIHPPVLFLGFAATLVPFCFAIAGLWKRDFQGWISPAIPWAFFGVALLGLGILMGGAWAYEALGFGGFWAWDPVENASLVPWIVLVAAAHLLVVNKRKPTALFSATIFSLLGFILVVYSTFLTRSGVLGDTSVHSFVESGILPQLLAYLLFFSVLSVGMFLPKGKERRNYWIISMGLMVLVAVFAGISAKQEHDLDLLESPMMKAALFLIILMLVAKIFFTIRAWRKYFPRPEKEEELWSREFWMFVGALVLFFCAAVIIIMTSLPIVNDFAAPFSGFLSSIGEATGWESLQSLAKGELAPPQDVIPWYHKWILPFSVIILVLIGFTQWLKYKKTDFKKFMKSLIVSFVITALISFYVLGFTSFSYQNTVVHLLLVVSIFAVVANLDYVRKVIKGKFDLWGPSVAHVGFALLIAGAIVSMSQESKISRNRLGDISQIAKEFSNEEDIALYQGDTLEMGPYFVSYSQKYLAADSVHLRCKIDYFEKSPKTYEEGDLVYIANMMFRCMEDHVAADSFLEQMETHWSQVPFPNERQIKDASIWASGVPGDYLYSLEPSILTGQAKGNSREPSIRHYAGKDLYTYLKYVDLEEKEAGPDGYLEGRNHVVRPGNRVLVSGVMVFVDSLAPVKDFVKYGLLETDLAAKTVLSITDQKRDTVVEPLFIIRDSIPIPDIVNLDDWGLKFALRDIDPQTGDMNLVIWEHESMKKDFIVMTASVFPMINLLWLGCIIMVIGTLMAVRHRYKLFRKSKK